MKKKLYKKISLNKKIISNLNENELNDIRGGSVIIACSRSCSAIIVCCDTKTIPLEAKIIPEKNIG